MRFFQKPLTPTNSAHLDMVRGLATVAVIAEHTFRLFFAAEQQHDRFLVKLAEYGSRVASQSVMVFFVLSGFFIAGILRRSVSQWTWKRYLIDRCSRIYVVLLPALLFTASIDILTRHTKAGALYLDRPLALFFSGPIASTHTLPIFFGNLAMLQIITVPAFGSDLPLWSLSSEFWYYMIAPCLCLAFTGKGRMQKTFHCVLLVLFAIFLPHRIVKYFAIWLLGALVQWIPTIRLDRRIRTSLLIMSVGLILVSLFADFTQTFSIWTMNLTFSIMFSIWLLVLVRIESPNGECNVYYHRAASALAGFSYSIYVTHFPILLLIRCYLGGALWTISWRTALIAVGLDILVISCGWLFSLGTEANTRVVRKWLLEATMGNRNITKAINVTGRFSEIHSTHADGTVERTIPSRQAAN